MNVDQNEIFHSYKCLIQLGEKHNSISLKWNFCGIIVVYTLLVKQRSEAYETFILDLFYIKRMALGLVTQKYLKTI